VRSVIDRKFDDKRKCQSEEWHTKNSLWLKKVRNNKSKIKLLHIYLFTINKDWCSKSLCLKVDLVSRPVEKCLDSYEKSSVHSNRHCWCLASLIMTMCPVTMCCLWGSFLISKNVAVVLQPQHFPYLFPCEYFFLTIKNHPRGHSEIISNIQRAVTDVLQDLTEEDFQQCLQGWKDCLQQCVASERIFCKGHVEL